MVTDEQVSMVAEAEWLSAVDDLMRAARSAGAVHRPLLLLYLFGRVQRGEPREVGLSEVEDGIKSALGVLGTAKKPDAMLPFWHMQSSPFWELLGGETLPLRESTARPTRKALLEAKGVLRPGWWDALVGNEELIGKLGERVLMQIWPTDAERATAAKAVGFERKPTVVASP